MIKSIIQLLRASEFYGESEAIEIAKGKHKLVDTVKHKMEQQKRVKKWRSKRL